MSNEKEAVYYVENGTMCSGWVLGTIEFEAHAENFCGSLEEMVKKAAFPDSEIDSVELRRLLEKQGVWLFLSGYQMVHASECFNSKEEAAKAFYESLISGDGDVNGGICD